MSADANNCDLQNVEYQRREISSRAPRFAKRVVTKRGDVSRRRFYHQQSAPACVWLTLAKQW